MHIIKQQQLIMLDVIYYRPSSHILQEFIWKFDDFVPEMPRTHKFLWHWKKHINAVIHSVLISEGANEFRSVDIEKFLN